MKENVCIVDIQLNYSHNLHLPHSSRRLIDNSVINSADRQGDRQINARVKITSCLAEILMET